MAATAIAGKTDIPILKFEGTEHAAPKVSENWPRVGYTEEQLSQLEAVKKAIPDILSKTPEIRAEEEQWCDDACVLRYLRATKWHTDATVKRIEKTLTWRREYQPHKIDPAEVEPEAIHGKEYVCGFDLQGRPLLYLIPRKEHTKTYERQLKYVVFNLEKAIKAMPAGVESLNILIDYEGISVFTAPPASQAKKVLQILGEHYPERLGMGFLFNPSWYLWVFFKVVGPFIDPVTRSKIHFVNLKKLEVARPKSASNSTRSLNGTPSSVTAAAPTAEAPKEKEAEGMGGWTNPHFYIHPDMLVKDYGGHFDFQYRHETYWKVLNETLP
ncbi:CRAL-TRIO domain-containing protein [Fimicolochytrium jonesii]|uniref:CRAL-TRIO domain-containing protein n=1 Tax=Fimicolochytrium jonesii TaxID=1396493 RepID=UPI0022FDEA31|nr:CRAL-TRIO domain-containing protein [Fimicolochytrium jonesii]KAI8820675.1 CRAL-TRIO domain-containing protein [Fimicolochytrium jonesii]